MKKILLYGIRSQDKLENLIDAAKKYDANTLVVGNEHMDQVVSDIIEQENKELYDEEPDINTEYMMLVGFGDEWNDFLDYLKKEDISISLMSKLTETSKGWELEYLIRHMLEERQMVTAFNASKRLIAYAKNLTDNEPNPEIDGLIGEIEIILNKPQFDIKALQVAYENLYNKLDV